MPFHLLIRPVQQFILFATSFESIVFNGCLKKLIEIKCVFVFVWIVCQKLEKKFAHNIKGLPYKALKNNGRN